MKFIVQLLMAATLAASTFTSFAADEKPASPAAQASSPGMNSSSPAAVSSSPAAVVSSPTASASGTSASAAPAAPAAPAEGAPAKPGAKMDLAKGEANFGAVCAACHGADGNSGTPAYPKLAQQHPEYLVKQLKEFKSGVRANPIMSGFAAALTEDDMRNISYWVTTKKAKAGFAKDKALVAMGEKIYRGGIADRQVPACAGCHSPNGAGIPSQYPRLAGQQSEYTATELIAFRDGGRKNSLPMQQVTAKLNDREIKALADYIAGLH